MLILWGEERREQTKHIADSETSNRQWTKFPYALSPTASLCKEKETRSWRKSPDRALESWSMWVWCVIYGNGVVRFAKWSSVMIVPPEQHCKRDRHWQCQHCSRCIPFLKTSTSSSYINTFHMLMLTACLGFVTCMFIRRVSQGRLHLMLVVPGCGREKWRQQ